jgi:uncharacterized membrane protein
MFTVNACVEIRRPPAEVFEWAGDYRNDPAWRAGVLAMRLDPEGPPAVGTRTHETMRSLGSVALTVAEVTAFTPQRTAFRSVTGPVPCDGSREFQACAAGTRFTYTLTLRPQGWLRLAEPLLRLVFARQVKADLQRLRQRLEAPMPTAEGTAAAG